VANDKQRKKLAGRTVYEVSGAKAIAHKITEKVELWQSNLETLNLFNAIMRFDIRSGYAIDWMAVTYMRKYEEIELTNHRQNLIVEAMNLLNTHHSKTQSAALEI